MRIPFAASTESVSAFHAVRLCSFFSLKKTNAASKSYTDYIMTSMIAIASFERRIEGERKKGDNSFGSK